MSYAKGTSVAVDKTRTELERLLSKHGATQRMLGSDDDTGFAFVVFRLSDRHVRLRIPLPRRDEKRFRVDGRGYTRSAEKVYSAWEQACRERWRTLLLLVKAKLEAIQLGLSTVEREFLADVYLPDGRTVHEALVEDLQSAYTNGTMPKLLGPGSP